MAVGGAITGAECRTEVAGRRGCGMFGAAVNNAELLPNLPDGPVSVYAYFSGISELSSRKLKTEFLLQICLTYA